MKAFGFVLALSCACAVGFVAGWFLRAFSTPERDELVRRAARQMDDLAHRHGLGDRADRADENLIAFDPNRNFAIIGDPDFLPVDFLRRGELSQRSVCRLTLTRSFGEGDKGSGHATAFLVGDSLIMTAAHSVNDSAIWAREYLEAVFDVQPEASRSDNDPTRFKIIDDPALSYINKDLDVAILPIEPIERDGRSASQVWGHIRVPPPDAVRYPEPDPQFRQPAFRINIIQHPKGRAKEIVVRSNVLRDVRNYGLIYTTDTEKGSSGSPMFCDQWRLLGVHLKEDELTKYNFGARIDHVVRDLESRKKIEILNRIGLIHAQ